MDVKRWTLNFISITFAIALALLYILVLRSLAVQITPPPEPIREAHPDISTPQMCEAAGGRWVEQANTTADKDFCRGPLAFERERNLQQESSRQTSLFVFAIGGALAVAGSLLVPRLKPVAPGLMLGGIVAFFFAGIDIWTLAPGFGRLVTIVIVFLILVGIGMYALRDEKDS